MHCGEVADMFLDASLAGQSQISLSQDHKNFTEV